MMSEAMTDGGKGSAFAFIFYCYDNCDYALTQCIGAFFP